MLIAVTGATGFLGGRVVESLANRGHDVLAFGRRPPAAFRHAEQAVLGSAHPWVILRPHAIYGPGETKLLPRLLAARRFGRLLAVGDGRNRISLTHVDNLVQVVERAIEPGSPTGIFNVADSEAEPLGGLLRALLLAFGLAPRVVYLPRVVAWPIAATMESAFRAIRAERPPLLIRYIVAQLASECVLDIRQAQNLLGYQPRRRNFVTLTR